MNIKLMNLHCETSGQGMSGVACASRCCGRSERSVGRLVDELMEEQRGRINREVVDIEMGISQQIQLSLHMQSSILTLSIIAEARLLACL